MERVHAQEVDGRQLELAVARGALRQLEEGRCVQSGLGVLGDC